MPTSSKKTVKKAPQASKQARRSNPITPTQLQEDDCNKIIMPSLFSPKSMKSASRLGCHPLNRLIKSCFNHCFRQFIVSDTDSIELNSTQQIIMDIFLISQLMLKFGYNVTYDEIEKQDVAEHRYPFIKSASILLESLNYEVIIRDQWLRDDTIFVMLDSINLALGHRKTKSSSSDSICFDSLIISNLISEMTKTAQKKGEKTFAKTFHEQINAQYFKSHIFNCLGEESSVNYLHFVLNVHGNHYNSVLVDVNERTVVSLDPYYNTDGSILYRSKFAKLLGVMESSIDAGGVDTVYLGKKDCFDVSFEFDEAVKPKSSFSHSPNLNINKYYPCQPLTDHNNCGIYSLYHIMIQVFNIPQVISTSFDPKEFRFQMYLYLFLLKIFLESSNNIPEDFYQNFSQQQDDQSQSQELTDLIKFFEICNDHYTHEKEVIEKKVKATIKIFYNKLQQIVSEPSSSQAIKELNKKQSPTKLTLSSLTSHAKNFIDETFNKKVSVKTSSESPFGSDSDSTDSDNSSKSNSSHKSAKALPSKSGHESSSESKDQDDDIKDDKTSDGVDEETDDVNSRMLWKVK